MTTKASIGNGSYVTTVTNNTTTGFWSEAQNKSQPDKPNLVIQPGDLRFGTRYVSNQDFSYSKLPVVLLVLEVNVTFDWNGTPSHKVLAGETEQEYCVKDTELFMSQAEAQKSIDNYNMWLSFSQVEPAPRKLKLPEPWKQQPALYQKQWTKNVTVRTKAKMWK